MERAELADILRPSYQKRVQSFNTGEGRFVYYTSAKAGLQILKERAIWMRAAACMNDYREIRYGIDLFNHMFYGSPERKAHLLQIVEAFGWHGKLLEELLLKINSDENTLVRRIFLTCISENEAGEESACGRLSMWRGYGRKTGMAFVLRAPALLRPGNQLPLTVSPVEYLSQEKFERLLDDILVKVEMHMEELRQMNRELLLKYFLDTVLFSVFSIKHPGFQEEREWRVIYREDSGGLEHEIVSIDGIPQMIYKIPLRLSHEAGPGLDMDALFDHLIIGPTEYADVIADAFVCILEELGFAHARDRVLKSNIPLR